MTLAVYASGTATISTTEYDIISNSTTINYNTAGGVFQLFLDLTALGAGDVYRLRGYELVANYATFLDTSFSGVQTPKAYASNSFILLSGWTFTVVKTSGTDRSIGWSLRQVA